MRFWNIKITHTNVQGKVNSYAKMRSKYCKKGVVPCKSMRKMIWPIVKTAILKYSQKKLFLNF